MAGVILGVLTVGVLAIAGPAQALTSTKFYEFNMSPAPGTVLQGGQTQTVTATITDDPTNTQSIGSANVFPPSGFTVTGASIDPSTPAPGATVTLKSACTNAGAAAGPCVQLLGASITPGASITLDLTIATPACVPVNSVWNWSAEVKQSNNFSGTPGNDFALSSTGNQLGTQLDGACSLKFVTQPADQLTSVNITSVEWDNSSPQAGRAVAVEVLASDGSLLSSSTAPITLSLQGGNPAAGLTGGGPVSASGGVASFGGAPPLAIDTPGSNYTFIANGPTVPNPLKSDTSTAFSIATFDSACSQGSNCTATTSAVQTTGQVTASVSQGSGFIAEYSDSNLSDQLGCLTSTDKPYPAASNDTYTYFTTDSFLSSKVVTITVTSLNSGITGNNPNKILKSLQICYGQPSPFTTAPGYKLSPATLSGGVAGNIGVLPDCGTVPASNPCHDRSSDAVIPDPKRPQAVDYRLVARIPSSSDDPAYRA